MIKQILYSYIAILTLHSCADIGHCPIDGFTPTAGIFIFDSSGAIYSPSDYNSLVFTHTFIDVIENSGVITDNDSMMTLCLYYDEKFATGEMEEPLYGIDTIFIDNTKSGSKIDTIILEFKSIDNRCDELEYEILNMKYLNGDSVSYKKINYAFRFKLYE